MLRHTLQAKYIDLRSDTFLYDENAIKIKYKPSAEVVDIFIPEPLEREAEADDSCCNRCVIL